MIITDTHGNILLEFQTISEDDLDTIQLDAPLTHALIVVTHQNRPLLMFNKWSLSWTLPGGVIEAGESPRECVIRELYEETNQVAQNISFKGLTKLDLQPDFHGPHRIEYGALFSGVVDNPASFVENEEAEKIMFWDGVSDIGSFEVIDRKLIDFA